MSELTESTSDIGGKLKELSDALTPFAEIARRLGWDKLEIDDPQQHEHIIEAPADDIAAGAAYCLMVDNFVHALRALNRSGSLTPHGDDAVQGDFKPEGQATEQTRATSESKP